MLNNNSKLGFEDSPPAYDQASNRPPQQPTIPTAPQNLNYGYQQPPQQQQQQYPPMMPQQHPAVPTAPQNLNYGYQQPPQQQQQFPPMIPQHFTREQLFQSIIQKHEIGHDYANRLQLLNGFKIAFIFDDSSSMNSTLEDSPLNKHVTYQKATRWNELEYFASISLEIANLFDPNGCDVYFLNKQPPIKNIKNVQEFVNIFKQIKPYGYTPLTRTLNNVLHDNANLVGYEKKLLIIIVTDGEPTDERGNSDINGFKKCLLSRKPIDRIFTSIIACTDEDDSIDYMNKWDRSIPNLDVVDDFRNEKIQILKSKGSKYRFSYGDYVVKSLLGSIDRQLDRSDEKDNKECIIS